LFFFTGLNEIICNYSKVCGIGTFIGFKNNLYEFKMNGEKVVADVKCSKPPRFGQCLVTGVVALSIFGSMICCCKNRII